MRSIKNKDKNSIMWIFFSSYLQILAGRLLSTVFRVTHLSGGFLSIFSSAAKHAFVLIDWKSGSFCHKCSGNERQFFLKLKKLISFSLLSLWFCFGSNTDLLG